MKSIHLKAELWQDAEFLAPQILTCMGIFTQPICCLTEEFGYTLGRSLEVILERAENTFFVDALAFDI